MSILSELENYCDNYYPLHMPGHKRGAGEHDFGALLSDKLPYSIDVTEVEDTDDLHNAHGYIKEAMDRTAAMYGVKRTWYLVNGSTCGNLVVVSAAAGIGDEIIVARNCHKSVFHAIELKNMRAHYVWPQLVRDREIAGSMSPDSIREALEKFPKSKAVVITSPTYEGILSDVRTIAEVCHSKGVPLIVDEAHGAHLGITFDGGCAMDYGFPDSAVHCGADIVVQSAHKTLPSLTQTAWIHQTSEKYIKSSAIEHQIDIFETTSPSYPLMCSLDECTGIMLEHGRELYSSWQKSLHDFDVKTSGLGHLKLLCHGAEAAESADETVFAHDPSKVLICGNGLNGSAIAGILRNEYGFEMEMTCGMNCLAMTGPLDDPAMTGKFAEAIVHIDDCFEWYLAKNKREHNLTDLGHSFHEGDISGSYVWAYPPGIPMILPGEMIKECTLESMRKLESEGTALRIGK